MGQYGSIWSHMGPYGPIWTQGPWAHGSMGPDPPGQMSIIISPEIRRRGKFVKIEMADSKILEKQTVQPEICATRCYEILPKFGLWFHFIWYVAAAPKRQKVRFVFFYMSQKPRNIIISEIEILVENLANWIH